MSIVTMILFLGDSRRFARRRILPVLARAIRQMRPSPEEIQSTLDTLKAQRKKLPKALTTDQIVDRLAFEFDD
jgi:hypothetical protein